MAEHQVTVYTDPTDIRRLQDYGGVWLLGEADDDRFVTLDDPDIELLRIDDDDASILYDPDRGEVEALTDYWGDDRKDVWDVWRCTPLATAEVLQYGLPPGTWVRLIERLRVKVG